MDWGDYGLWSPVCPQGGGICGIESKVEEYQSGLDDSSLNDVRFFCCDRRQQVEQAPLSVCDGGLGCCDDGWEFISIIYY